MAKRRKVLPARRRRDTAREDSILLRSAESVGRVIGTLQRQLDEARNRWPEGADRVRAVVTDRDGSRKRSRKKAKKKTAARRVS